jgi:UDP-glucose-4-epimerase GalE
MLTRSPSTVLVTGAAGYIGTTLLRRLLADGAHVIALDSLERGHAEQMPREVQLIVGDIRDPDAVRQALNAFDRPPEACIHLAGLIQVGESTLFPDLYRSVNAVGTQVVADLCLEAGVPALVMASSAAVLRPLAGVANRLDEDSPVGPESPYGSSKLSGEYTLRAAAELGRMSTVALRLFNVCGAAYGLAERHDPETHLIPLALRAAAGELPPLHVFGEDFATPDGTCLRDYVHVRDVVEAFVRSARLAMQQTASGTSEFQVLHVGTGRGHSVHEVIASCEAVLGKPVPHVMHGRRPGDVAALVADPTRLAQVLGLHPDADLQRMVRDAAESLGLVRG